MYNTSVQTRGGNAAEKKKGEKVLRLLRQITIEKRRKGGRKERAADEMRRSRFWRKKSVNLRLFRRGRGGRF